MLLKNVLEVLKKHIESIKKDTTEQNIQNLIKNCILDFKSNDIK